MVTTPVDIVEGTTAIEAEVDFEVEEAQVEE